MPRTLLNGRRSRTSCSMLALATVMVVGASPAAAQSLNGTGVFATNTGGAANISTGLNTTTVTLNAGNTVINWTPTDNATNTSANIVFQNAGTTAAFTSSAGDFAVLNNINSASLTRAIEMNGAVTARVGGAQRGSVYFYAPGGFLFGGGSSFSVGSLVVTTLPISNAAFAAVGGSGFGSVAFGQAPTPGSTITMNGTVSAQNLGFAGIVPPTYAYVAMVAPRVVHNGTITVNGSAALVAAEAATINFSPDGLFDISVSVGSTDSEGINVHGDITGPTPTGSSDKQGIYLVAVPKNDAMTMVIGNGADLGFTLANTAVDDNGTIVLSAGHDLVDGAIGSESAGSGAAANFWFTGAHATNNVIGEATGYANLYSLTDLQPTTTFGNDVTVHAVDHVWMNASGAGAVLTVGGDVSLSTDAFGDFSGGTATGGETSLYALNGGSLTINGSAVLSANGYGGSSETSGVAGGAGIGGRVSVSSTSSSNLQIVGDLTTTASGFGGDGLNDVGGGSGTGGKFADNGGISIFTNGATLGIGGDLTVEANGTGGMAFQPGATTGSGGGGNISISAGASGTLSVDGNSQIDAEGYGGDVGFRADAGSGTGGKIELFASGSNATLDFTGDLVLSADGFGGDEGFGDCTICGGQGGDGFGGGTDNSGGIFVSASGTGASLIVGGEFDATADGHGSTGYGANAGFGKGGKVQLFARDNGSIEISGDVELGADGEGGWRVENGYGEDLDAFAGNGEGGFVELFTFGTGAPSIDIAGEVELHASGFGGDNLVDGVPAFGGSGTGGTAWLDAQSGTLDITGNVIVAATGHGGDAAHGTGGDGTGKNAEIDGVGGAVTISGTALVDVSGHGGDGQVAGGDGTGAGVLLENGDIIDGALIYAQNGSVNISGTATVSSIGEGGNGLAGDFSAVGGAGGDGTGGLAVVLAANSNLGPSSITLSTLNISASATGGAGGQGGSGNQGGNGGAGGDAEGGSALTYANAGNGHVGITTVNASAMATGGDGGNGGNGDGESGGNGGQGGDAEGGGVGIGTASGNFNQAAGSNLGTANYGSITANASATGGDGGDGNFGSTDGNGGNGGTGDGGLATLLVRGSAVTVTGTTALIANGSGGDGGSAGGETATGGAGANGYAGELQVIASSRFMIPTQHATLTTGAIVGTATGTGGLGSTNGAGIVKGGSVFNVDNTTATIASLNFTVSGGTVDPGADESRINITNSTVNATGLFGFSTPGDLSFYINNGSLHAGTLALAAGNFVDDVADVAADNRGTAFANSATITTGGDFIADANFNIGSNLVIAAPGLIDAHNFTVAGNLQLSAASGGIDADQLTSTFAAITLDANGDINLAGDLLADGEINLTANGLIDMQSANGGFFRGDAGGTFDASNIISDADIRISAGDDVTLGNLTAGVPAGESSKAVRIDTDGSVLVGNILSAGGIDITAGGSVTGQNITTGDVLVTEADGAIVFQNISAGIVNPQPPSESFAVALDSGTSISVGSVVASRGVAFITPGTLTTLDLTTDTDVLGLVHGAINTGDINAGNRVLLADSSMFTNAGGTVGDAGDDNINPEDIFAATPIATGSSITVGDVNATTFIAAAGTSLTTGLIESDTGIGLDAGGAILTGNLVAGDFVLANGGSITTGSIDADSVEMASTGGNITVNGNISAFGDVELDAFGDILTQDITAGSIDLFAGDDIGTGDLTTHQLVLLSLGDGIHTLLFPGASITLESGGDIVTGDISSVDGVYADAGGSISTGTIDAVDFVELFAGTDISTGYIDAGSYISAEAGDDISTGNLLAGSDIDFENGGDLAFGNADAGIEFSFETDGSVTGGNVIAGLTIEGEAGGSIQLGNLTAGFDSGEALDDDTFSVGMQAFGAINVGNVNGANRVGFASGTNLTTGNITSGWDVFAFADGNIVTGSITSGEGDQVFMSGLDAFFAAGGGEDSDFVPDDALAGDPSPTDGSITINGPVSAGAFRAAAGTTLTTQAVTASDANVFAGGTAVINGAWNVGDAKIVSNDIDITATGSITAGDISLISKHATRTIVGDGVNLIGYHVSDAEYDRLHANDINVIADTARGAAPIMVIGNLTVTAPGGEGGVEYGFLTGNESTETAAGTIRVAGNAVFTGMTSSEHEVDFATGTFELDAATGSLSLFSSGTDLGGSLDIWANRVHVASATILNQLAANPTYTGYQQDLNKAATVQRPEGVLRADTINFGSENLQDILIQNTGTTAAPAGFLVRQAFINDEEEVAGPPGSINLVVNGQVVTEGGTLTGVEARDELVGGEDTTPFTANSTINGCPLTGVCIIKPPAPPPTADVVHNQIDLIMSDPLGEGEFGNEQDVDDNEEGDQGAGNPINPPQPLFDTRPLVPGGDVNDPVSGTGNPALLGGDPDCEASEDAQCPAPVKGGDK